MPDAASFWNRKADKYAESPVKNVPAYEETLERTRKHLGPGDEALELGCGTGSTALRLAPQLKSLLATDISTRMIEIARDKASAEELPGLRFEEATLLDESLRPGSFDVVLAFNLLHLLDDLPGAVARVHALLRPGGRFVSKTVCLGDQTRLWALVLRVARWIGVAPPVQCLTAAELEGTLVHAGFEIVEAELLPPPWSRFVVARKR